MHNRKGVKRIFVGAALCLAAAGALFAVGCTNDATVVNENMKNEAENFHVLRRVVFLNTRTDKYELLIEGYCNLDKGDSLPDEVIVLCKTQTGYQKHFEFLGGDLRMFVQQLDATDVNPNHYVLTFKPEVVIPSINVR